jgi:hypothetical protein
MPLAETKVPPRITAEGTPATSSGLLHDRFHPLPHVVSARAGDTTVLMDRKRGTYHTLNDVSGRIWELLGSSASTSEIVDRLLAEYHVARQQLQADVATAVGQFLEDRLIAPGLIPGPAPFTHHPAQTSPKAGASGELRVPSVMRCGVMLLVLKTLLRVRGYGRTIDWIRRQVGGISALASVEVDAVKDIEHAVAMAGALYPGRALCLEQSLVLYYLLRRKGALVRFRMGVQPHPFLAHAWVEYLGTPINDIPEHVRCFAPLPHELP